MHHVRTTLAIVCTSAAILIGAVCRETAWAEEPVAEASDSASVDAAPLYHLSPIVVTATRTPRAAFLSPYPVAVLDRNAIGALPFANLTDVFSELPGLDVNGTGSNQRRPTIRGHRGQRILLLEDGTRLNNARRQQDFGEIPSLVDAASIDRVEIVRGPGSVLYGTDAIGGVVNFITNEPMRDGWHGFLGYRYGSEGVQNGGRARLEGRGADWSLAASGTLRNAGAFAAPGGDYGAIELDGAKVVRDSGIQDESGSIRGGYDFSDQLSGSLKFERYHADTAGFGYVDPADYDPASAFVRILYPEQTFSKTTLGVNAKSLESRAADRVEAIGYYQTNERRFNLNVVVPIGPGAQVDQNTFNFTDLETFGGRFEAAKGIAANHIVTYGFDAFRDLSRNTDSSIAVVTGFGPPIVETTNTPLVPNATYRSAGIFAQDEWKIGSRTTLVFGARGQQVVARTLGTPGVAEPKFESDDTAIVGSASALVRVTNDLAALASVGRAFRSPNLVERFFNGPTPEGFGFQARNLELDPETSVDANVGLRWRNSRAGLEGHVFRTKISDGIRIAATGDSAGGLPEYQNVNIDELVHRGAELSGDARLAWGLRAGGEWSTLDAENDADGTPVGEGYEMRVGGWLGWTSANERWWGQYHVRHVAERDDLELGANPIGDTIPAFTVHAIRAGARLVPIAGLEQRVGVAVENLTDELYAEFSNVSFFRPEPRRNFVVTWETRF